VQQHDRLRHHNAARRKPDVEMDVIPEADLRRLPPTLADFEDAVRAQHPCLDPATFRDVQPSDAGAAIVADRAIRYSEGCSATNAANATTIATSAITIFRTIEPPFCNAIDASRQRPLKLPR